MTDTSEKGDDKTDREKTADSDAQTDGATDPDASGQDRRSEEVGGPKGPEPTRYGDWEKNGIASDF